MFDRIPDQPPLVLPVLSGKKRPLWSIMIPAYNCIAYLKETIESVLLQDAGEDFMQIEVVDDCSTDGDVKALVREVGKGRVGFFRQDRNQGSLRNFETCLSRSRGHYIHLLHGDDRIKPGFYLEIENLFSTHPEAGAAFTNYSFMNEHGHTLGMINDRILDKPGILKNFINQIGQRQLIQPPAMVVKRTVYEKVGGFYAVHFGEDWEMWSRISFHFPIAYSPKTLAQYRISHHSSISHRSFQTGQNIKDINKVIGIIQAYLPINERKVIKKVSQEYYSIYCLKVANSLLAYNRKDALTQAIGALRMYKSLKTYFWAVRFYLMYIFWFKQLKSLFIKKKVFVPLVLPKSVHSA